MSIGFFRRITFFRVALLFGFITFICFNGLSWTKCSESILDLRPIQDPLILLRNIFPLLLTAIAIWVASKPIEARLLNFVLRYIACPLFVTYGILGLYISDMLCYSNIISNQLVYLYVDGWLSEIVNFLFLGLFLGTIYGLSVPALRRILVCGYSTLEWIVAGEKPQVHRMEAPINHNDSLFLARSATLSMLMPLVLSFTTPIYQEVTSNPPGVALYSFNSALQMSLLTIPLLVLLGESLTLTFDRGRRLSEGYFRWLLAALSLGAVATFAFSLSKFHFDPNGVAFLAQPIASTLLMFVGSSIASRFSLKIAERYLTRGRILAFSVVGMLLCLLFLVELNFDILFLGKNPNHLLVAWSEMLFVTDPLLRISTYLSASTFIYVLSFVALVLFSYRRQFRTILLTEKLFLSTLLAVLLFVYQWASPNGSASTWRSVLTAVISGILTYLYLGTGQFLRTRRFLNKQLRMRKEDGRQSAPPGMEVDYT